jgi:lipopolysaccharide export system permease protein
MFDRYAFDLSSLGPAEQANYEPREQPIGYLMHPDPKDPVFQVVPGRFRSELHERLVNPLYPIAFVAIAFVALGRARTTRQNRVNVIIGATVAVFAVRLAGLGATNLVARAAWAVPLLYFVALAPTIGCLALIFGPRVPWPNWHLPQLRLRRSAA